MLISYLGPIKKGVQISGMGLSLSDTTIKELTFVIKGGNLKNAFCFGKPDLFDKKIPDHSGMLYIYNPEIIIAKGSGTWLLDLVVYDSKTGKIIYKCRDGFLFPNIVSDAIPPTSGDTKNTK